MVLKILRNMALGALALIAVNGCKESVRAPVLISGQVIREGVMPNNKEEKFPYGNMPLKDNAGLYYPLGTVPTYTLEVKAEDGSKEIRCLLHDGDAVHRPTLDALIDQGDYVKIDIANSIGSKNTIYIIPKDIIEVNGKRVKLY